MLTGIRWGSLRNKIIAWSFVPTALIMALVAGVTFTAYQQVTEDLVVVRNQELARFSAGELAAGLTEYTGLLTEYAGLLSGLPRIAYADDSDLVIEQDVLARARSRFEVFDGGVLILNNQGTVVAAEPERPDALSEDWSSRPYFRHMLRSPAPVFSDVVADGPQGAEVIVVAVPIRGDQGQFQGLMAGMFRLDLGAANPLYRDLAGLRIGESASNYLVDGAGRAIYHFEPARIGDNLLAQAMVQQVLAGEVGSLRTRDVENRDIVASFAPVPGTAWGLVGEETWAELTSSVQGYRRFLSALLVLGVLLPALVVAFGVRRITQPITQLIAAAQEVAAGDFSQTITAPTGDEIEVLAGQFNDMAAQLKESYAHLERRVEDRTRELAALNALAATVSQSLHLGDILDEALSKTLNVMELEAGGIYLLDGEAGVLSIAAQRGFSRQFIEEIDNLKLGEGFSGRVAQSGEPLVARDVSADARLTREAVKAEGLRSLASVPLCSKREVLGTLFVSTRGHREFSTEDVQLLTSIGNQIGVAVENARLYEDTKNRLVQLAALQETAGAVASTLELDRLLDLIVNRATTLLQADGGILNLIDWENNEDEAVACAGMAASVLGSRAPLGETLSGWVALNNQVVISNQLQEDQRVHQAGLRLVQAETGRPIRNAMVTPLTIKDQVVGTLFVLDKMGGKEEFEQSDVALLSALANQAAMAIENARLFEAESEQRKEATLLAEMAKLTSGTLDLDEVLGLTAEYAIDAFGAQCCCIYLLDETQGTLRPAVQLGMDGQPSSAAGSVTAELAREITFRPSPRMQQIVFDSLQPLIIEDVPSEPHLSPSEPLEFQSVLVVPIEVGGRRLGALQVATRPPLRRRFSVHEGELALALANQAAVAIENARLFDVEQRRADQFRVISELGRRTTSILNTDELLDQMVRLLQRAFDYDVVEIGLVEGDDLVFRAGIEKGSVSPFQGFRIRLEEEGITGWVAATGEALCVPDVSQDPRFVQVTAMGSRSELAVPIKAQERVIGVLNAQSDQLAAFDESDLTVLQALANQAAVAIENARHFEAERRRAEQFRVISEVGRRTTSILAIEELLEQMARLIQEAFRYDLVTIGLVEGDELVFRAGAERDSTSPFEDLRVRIGTQGITGWVAATGDPLLVPDVDQDPRFVRLRDTETRSELAVPIMAKDKVIGVLNIQNRRLDAFDESDLAVMQALADQAAIAIENARLFEAEQHRAEQFRVISNVGRHITSILDIDQMLVQVVQSIQQAFGYEHVGIALIEGDYAEYKVGAGDLWDQPGFQFVPARHKVGEEGITGWVAGTGESLLAPDVRQHPNYIAMQGSRTRSELAVPIKAKGRVAGVLDVQSDRLGAFDESDLTVLQALAHQAAIVIENARLYEQAQRLAVVEERGRLARELHDAVTQTLFSASLIAETLPSLWESDQEEGKQLLRELQQLNRGAMAEMRTLLLELRPAALVEASLDGLLRQLGEAVTGRTGIPATVTVDGECALPADAHVALYRIAQEALNNVVKHARASHVSVSLHCLPAREGEQERVELIVADDGIGFASSDVEPGELGLGIMHERAMSIGASFEIESFLGRGTTVSVVWTG